MSARPAGNTERTASEVPVPVLMYHSVATGSTRKFRRFVVSPAEFAAQMKYLDAAGYRPVTAVELAGGRSGGPLPPRPVVLTFDDAYTDFYSAALPVLREHGFRATLYVPTAYVGGTTRFNVSLGEENRAVLSWQALADIAAEGIEVAAHSHTHPQLDACRRRSSARRPGRSRALLEDELGVAVEGFAYPFGYWNRAARDAVAAAGYRYAFAVAELMTAPGDESCPRCPGLPSTPGSASLAWPACSAATRRLPAGAPRRSSGSPGGRYVSWCRPWGEIPGKDGP